MSAFGVGAKAEKLAGGQGDSWRAGDIVLKPAVEGAEWIAQAMGKIKGREFRIPRPIPAKDGHYSFMGWCAWSYLEGAQDTKRVPEILEAGRQFHAAVAGLERPDFLELRSDPWAIADRMAWGERTMDCHPLLMGLIKELQEYLRPFDAPEQLVHCDLIGNVLFQQSSFPGIIDFSFYWRPVEYASAIVVVDALDWHGADASIFNQAGSTEGFLQALLRAEIFRIAVYQGFQLSEEELKRRVLAHAPIVALLRRQFK
ncbi:MAG: phosphotransferase [candidate division FCPU426 bacterium]